MRNPNWTITREIVHVCGCQENLTYSAYLTPYDERRMLYKKTNSVCCSCQTKREAYGRKR